MRGNNGIFYLRSSGSGPAAHFFFGCIIDGTQLKKSCDGKDGSDSGIFYQDNATNRTISNSYFYALFFFQTRCYN